MHNSKCDLKDFPRGTKPLAKNDKGEWVDPITSKKINIANIPEREFDNFVNGTARPVKIEPGMTLYRVYGGDKAKVDGAYWTLEPPKTKETWKNDYAVLDEWDNDAILHAVTDADFENI